mmetsp:Transcript_59920/g.178312  ORF Transcript_59920/g.178312 Transcript_59920/m.178312 type:complete len:231 (+) Transcript_59920:752-1444(+)
MPSKMACAPVPMASLSQRRGIQMTTSANLPLSGASETSASELLVLWLPKATCMTLDAAALQCALPLRLRRSSSSTRRDSACSSCSSALSSTSAALLVSMCCSSSPSNSSLSTVSMDAVWASAFSLASMPFLPAAMMALVEFASASSGCSFEKRAAVLLQMPFSQFQNLPGARDTAVAARPAAPLAVSWAIFSLSRSSTVAAVRSPALSVERKSWHRWSKRSRRSYLISST